MARSKNVTGVPVRIPSEGISSRPAGETAPPESDEDLASQVARGSSAALEALYDRYAATVLGLAFKVIGDQAMAEDVLQETFWRVWKSARTYRSDKGTFTGWLFRIARNLAIDAYRRRNVRPQVMPDTEREEPALERVADPTMDVPEQAQSLLTSSQVRKALAALPAAQRQVIELAYFYGMTRQDIAAATGDALGTINTRARLALQKLREELDREEFEG